jgi:beta-lactamase regulating signal transducer with metallopeptidase domain
MILALVAVRYALRGRVSSRLMVAAWVVVAVRLVVPVSLPAIQLHQTVDLTASGSYGQALGSGADLAGAVSDGLAGLPLLGGALEWLPRVWLAGTVLCAAVLGAQCLLAFAQVRTSRPTDNGTLRAWAAGAPLRRRLQVRECPKASAPLTYGVLRPVVLVPPGFLRTVGEREALLALRHELAHVRRCDVLLKLLFSIAACIHWFNPLVWAMRALANRDLELSCDEWALRGCRSDDRSRYARTLALYSAPRFAQGATMAAFAPSRLEERVEAVLRGRSASVSALAAVAVTAALGLALGVGGMVTPAAARCLDVTIDTPYFSFQVPEEWQDKVAVCTDGSGSALYVYPAGYPEQWLLEFRVTEGDALSELPEETLGCTYLVKQKTVDGATLTVRAVNYLGMSLGDAWATSYVSNPSYPGLEGEKAVVLLSTGGAWSADKLHATDLTAVDLATGFDYYRDVVAQGIVVPGDAEDVPL